MNEWRETEGGREGRRGEGEQGEGVCWQVAVPYGRCCIPAAHARVFTGG